MAPKLKKLLSLAVCAALAVGMLAACGEKPETVEETPTEPAPTEPAEEAKVLKFLTLGSSSSVDSCHLLNLVLSTEGVGDYEEVIVGTLYYSGCRLSQHVQFLTQNSPEYKLYLSSSKTPDSPPEIMESVTMQAALQYDYWDIIFMQANGGEFDQDDTLTNGNIEIIRDYVNQYKRNPLAYFGWHFTSIYPVDPDLTATYPYSPNPYYTTNEKYGFDREAAFAARAGRMEKFICADETYKLIICSITAVQNACTSYLTEKDLYRDYTHSTDLARVMTSYVWYCRLMGVEQLEEIKLDAIPKQFLRSTADKTQDRVLTEMEKKIILESVNNALKDPLKITPSQYTEAPTA